MTTVHCGYRGCSRTFSNENPALADTALRMHIGRAHKRSVVPRTEREKARRTGSAKPTKTAKQSAKPARTAPSQADVTINFCPGCGCDLHRIAVGIALSNRI